MADFRLIMTLLTQQRPYRQIEDLASCSHRTIARAKRVLDIEHILASRDGHGSTVVTSQFDPEEWYRSLHDAGIAQSILNRIVSNAELVQLNGPNMRRHVAEQLPLERS